MLPLRKNDSRAPDAMIDGGVALWLSQNAAAAPPRRQTAMVRLRSRRSLSQAPAKYPGIWAR